MPSPASSSPARPPASSRLARLHAKGQVCTLLVCALAAGGLVHQGTHAHCSRVHKVHAGPDHPPGLCYKWGTSSTSLEAPSQCSQRTQASDRLSRPGSGGRLSWGGTLPQGRGTSPPLSLVRRAMWQAPWRALPRHVTPGPCTAREASVWTPPSRPEVASRLRSGT